jgi:hypothetical protein
MIKFNYLTSLVASAYFATGLFAFNASASPNIPSLKICGEPIAVHVSESQNILSEEMIAQLKSAIESKGHRMTTSEDLYREKRSLEPYSFVYRRNTALSLVVYSPNIVRKIKFPMTFTEFKNLRVHENLNNPILNGKEVYLAVEKLKALDRKRLTGQLTESEKNTELASFFTDAIFVDDAVLAGLRATYVMAFSPHEVNPFFETMFRLEAGKGNGEQHVVVGTSVSAVEAKKRAKEHLFLGSMTIGDLGKPYEVSDLPTIISRMLRATESGDFVTPSEIYDYYLQMISVLPNCKNPKIL